MSELLNISRRILCVGADPDSKQLLERALAEHEVVFAVNAADAIARVNARVFHAYVLSQWLPDWNGPSLCRHIRELDPYAPVVFCTATESEQQKRRAMRAGASAYIDKRVDAAVLRSRLRELIAIADRHSLAARFEAESVVQEELERTYRFIQARSDSARELMSSVERVARAKARKVFIHARGIGAHFEAWWPQVFASVSAARVKPRASTDSPEQVAS